MKKRADGVQIKIEDPMYTIIPYIMDKRYDAMNMITLDIPVEPMQKYLNRKRKEGFNMSHLSLVVAAYLRAAAEYPGLNRFVVNKRIFARNEFPVAMVVLKPGEKDGTMNKVYFQMSDDIFEVQRKMDAYIEKNRQTGDNNSTDKLMRTMLSIPGLCTVLVWMFKFLDKHGWLPHSIIDASPFHVSLTISNLASIRTNHIYHHTYEFGTTSMFITLGNMREVAKRVKDEIVYQRCLPLGCVMDERICSGSYFAMAFSRIRSYLNDPTLLEGPPLVLNADL